ncbi:BZ3500_MvSof-1268-A1-R1_Chr1-3g01852 [Microbotryum saponariae]|uniref:BZ3500_MvSof-1268-A1-R1_Chr1-3g01852 protein n=1 Tax=Microbotryum saponariae TaxID=289078 RepID=A0A2X0L7D7_9BASI|nr:BZ3500_MvSof-1268-A1-R1_Chr1-3g01852 [Microbotryum saponariae]SCZ94741.1 BZ3501_MvSof-1269-A2-R1_Chr1-3g01454 [Microbotryum saponariae]
MIDTGPFAQVQWSKTPSHNRRQIGGNTTTVPTRRRRDSSITIAGDEDAPAGSTSSHRLSRTGALQPAPQPMT